MKKKKLHGVKLKKSIKKVIFVFSIFLCGSSALMAQNYSIEYYGVVSEQIDSNMARMTSDLYYTQLSEISSFSVEDKRTSPLLSKAPDNSSLSDSSLSFYTLITKEENSDRWQTTFFVIDRKNKQQHSKQKTYDSFYKILMESKNVLKETIRQLVEGDAQTIALSDSAPSMQVAKSVQSEGGLVSTESLSGTWTGEENIDKIVILRGGRGFAIFKNGASMNITVEISGDNLIKIIQKGRSNASFYPELPRSTALNAAISAPPIEWTLSIVDANTLSGSKKTLVPDGEDFKIGNVKVSWKRSE